MCVPRKANLKLCSQNVLCVGTYSPSGQTFSCYVQVYKEDGSVLRTWTCSNADCSHCEGYWCFSGCSLTVSYEETVLSPLLDCKYGDTVKFQCTDRAYDSFSVYEISMTGRKGD